jgi:hypothetical protein
VDRVGKQRSRHDKSQAAEKVLLEIVRGGP